MHTVDNVVAFLEQFAPPELAEDWDNVGLLVGDRAREARRVMTCLTVTPATTAEAVAEQADLIVTHHPMPFRPVKRLTADTTVGRLLLELTAARIAVFSPHTAFDSAPEGINQRLAAGLGLRGIWPLVCDESGRGAGRWGWLPEPLSLAGMAERVKAFLAIERLQMVGDPGRSVRTVAVACGAAGEFLNAARDIGCECMVVGETQFHTCLEAEAANVGLLLPGHFASERFAVECLADVLAEQFPELGIWAAKNEQDPLRWA
ncbi:MAG: Nif3-like dinuclear metal center hexameric protein [Candidatus Nealsonbacteria bacterium]|nr:Nif3-like dinuclear metal center hexameric protein [Candidatus Nealsonbacteria bacterium]